MRGHFFSMRIMPVRLQRRSQNSGFTLVELILVLTIIGILSVFVAPRLNTTAFTSRSNLDQAKAMLRYAQKIAIAQHRQVFVVFSGGSASLCFDALCGARVLTPTNVTASLPAGTTGTTFSFNALGQPSSASVNTVTLSDGSTILIQPETGYVR
jgi:MSHA pilin protein MshC